MPPKSVDPLHFLSAARLTVVAGKGWRRQDNGNRRVWRARQCVADLRVLVLELDGKPALHGARRRACRRRRSPPRDALAEYLDTHGLKRVSKRLISSGVIDVVATAAPGIDDIVVLGKVKQLERSGDWDLILVDGPAAGHAITMLLRRQGHARHGARRAAAHAGAGGRDDARRPDAHPGGAGDVAGDHADQRARGDGLRARGARSACTSARWWSTRSTSATTSTSTMRPSRSAMRAAAEFRNARRAAAARRVRSPGRPSWPSCNCHLPALRRADARRRSDRTAGDDVRSAPWPQAWRDGAGRRRRRRAEVVVCCGTGGVGKTTTAAALGLQAASLGRRAVVVTIDPAKRLADALGVPGGLTQRPGPPADRAGSSGGELWALMLDTATTFDGLVAANAASPQQAERILSNAVLPQRRRLVQRHAGLHGRRAAARAARATTASTSSSSTRRRRATPSTSSTPRA